MIVEPGVRDVLLYIREKIGAKDAVIAGGYLRDRYLGREAKDVDIWCKAPQQFCRFNELAISAMLRGELGASGLVWLHSVPGTSAAKWCKAVLKFTLNGRDYDLIFLPNSTGDCGQAVIEEFDFGICMAAYDGRRLNLHDLFLDDVTYKTLTFNPSQRARDDMNRVINDHLPRIKAKFPEYTVHDLPVIHFTPISSTGGCGLVGSYV